MKGISPLIATVIIILIVVVIAVAVFLWGDKLVEKIKERQEVAQNELLCSSINFEFKQACTRNSQLNLLIENKWDKEIVSELFRLRGELDTSLQNGSKLISSFGLENFVLPYDQSITGSLGQLEVIPSIKTKDGFYTCKNFLATPIKECPCPVEGLEISCGKGVGVCAFGKQACQGGKWTNCSSPIQPLPEVCNYLDDDCDGSIDETCNCIEGDTKSCGSDVGECVSGRQVCANGKWGDCLNAMMPVQEICDKKDNSCDGAIDEVCECEETSRVCGPTLPNGSLNMRGICKSGAQPCNSGFWGECSGGVFPQKRECTSDLDNDCNSKSDLDDAKRLISNAPGAQYKPDIYGNIIVWVDTRGYVQSQGSMSNIYMYDLTTKSETRITDEYTTQSEPRVYGNVIVWEDQRNGNRDIYMYDLTTRTETQVTTDPPEWIADPNKKDYLYQFRPDVYNNLIVWEDSRNGPYNSDIYMCNLSKNGQSGGCLANDAKTQVTSNTRADTYPKIYGNVIVWEYDLSNFPLHSEIYMCDLSKNGQSGGCLAGDTKTQVTKLVFLFSGNSLDSRTPDIYDNLIVWQGTSDLNKDNITDTTDIYMCDLNKNGQNGGCLANDAKTQITQTIPYDQLPKVDGEIIIYFTTPPGGGNYTFYMYNIPSQTFNRIASSTDPLPAYFEIFENKIAYSNSTYDLYLYTPRC
ncbi:hypothetical protein HY643_02350 [Candidatus Woesearchaeota archaeon]|nr:hypothetical protein [Candidatus Woesearchaeota archaeon]